MVVVPSRLSGRPVLGRFGKRSVSRALWVLSRALHAIKLAETCRNVPASRKGRNVAPGHREAPRRDNRTRWDELPLVSGAVIYDFSTRDTAVYPDAELGRAALRNAVEGSFPVGRCGAGRTASAGKVDFGRAEFAGQGAAFGVYGEAKVLVATVVNAVGAVVDRDGAIVRGNYHEGDGLRRHPREDYAAAVGDPAPPVMGNTTLTVLVTNVKLSDVELLQVGRQVHSSMHRGIQPFHTMNDGDVLFAMTTDEVDLAGVKPTGLGTLASEVAWDAILSAVE
ncbi:P1 family peptidase [Nonomuraea purpurea]|uniref:P1 family peptidase n=1 Tax=Nonomuraea purpurea TaxID=1849276 RepID=A0ABV8FWK5_9ACTN